MKTKKFTPAVLIMTFLFIGWAISPLMAENPTFKLPKYEKFTLKNGLTVYLMEQHEVPLITVSALFPAGADKDGDRFGLASLTADSLFFGSKNFSKKQIEENLEFLGASYSSGASKETARVSMSFVNTDTDKIFPIIKDIIQTPTFDQSEFEKHKKRTLLELEQDKEQPAGVIGYYFGKFLFGNHPYGNPETGIPSTVEKITASDLKTFYDAYYRPEQSCIAVVGDFQAPRMKEKIKKLFEDWKAQGKPVTPETKSIPSYDKSRILLVDKKDATETQFIIGTFGIPRNNPDYVSIQVINTILGGRFTSWLNDALRVNAGLTYGAGSGFDALKSTGTFTINSYTRTEFTVKAIDMALDVLNRLHTTGIDEATLSSAKNYIKGMYPPRYETAGSLANLLTSMFFYNFDESFINNFQQNVDSMSIEKTKEIIAKYFPKDKLTFVLIGKASEILEQVKKYGELTEKDLKTEGF